MEDRFTEKEPSVLPAEVRFALAFRDLVATLHDEYGQVTPKVGKALQRVVVAGTVEGAHGDSAGSTEVE